MTITHGNSNFKKAIFMGVRTEFCLRRGGGGGVDLPEYKLNAQCADFLIKKITKTYKDSVAIFHKLDVYL